MQSSIKAFVYWGETYYVGECLTIAVVTQGKTLDETIANLQEAVAFYLEEEDSVEFGIAPRPALPVSLELGPARHAR